MTYWRECSRRPPTQPGTGPFDILRKVGRTEFCSSLQWLAYGCKQCRSYCGLQLPKGQRKQNQTLFQGAQQKTKRQETWQNMGFLTRRAVRHWNVLPGATVEPLQTQLDEAPSDLTWLDSLSELGVEQDGLQRPYPGLIILWFYEYRRQHKTEWNRTISSKMSCQDTCKERSQIFLAISWRLHASTAL